MDDKLCRRKSKWWKGSSQKHVVSFEFFSFKFISEAWETSEGFFVAEGATLSSMSSLQPLRSPLGVLCESSADICHVIVDFLGTTRSAIQLACASRAWYEHVCSADVWASHAASVCQAIGATASR